MIINIGTGPPVATQFRIKPDFKPATRLGRSYEKLDSGNWRAVDYGASADIFDSQITFVDTFANLSLLLGEIDRILANRSQMYIQCEVGEEIFGADIDYAALTQVAFFKIGDLQRVNLRLWEIPMLVRMIVGSPINSAGSLSSLRFNDHTYVSSTYYETNLMDTGGGAISNSDHRDKDLGVFNATFLQKTSEMISIRCFIRQGNGRANTFLWPNPDGINKIFGPRQAPTSYYVRIVDWKDEGKIHPQWWKISMRLAQEW